MIVNMICIGCPMGCPLSVTIEDGIAVSVTGNTCGKGKKYAENEVIAPVRIVTSTTLSDDGIPVPVKTKVGVPKTRMFDVVRAIKSTIVCLPVKTGDTIIENVAETGVAVIATKTVSKQTRAIGGRRSDKSCFSDAVAVEEQPLIDATLNREKH